jgi:hypothetical protein
MDKRDYKAINKELNPPLQQCGVMPRCSSCRFWRDKGWDGDEGIGKCDNPIVIEQVSIMSEEMIERFVTGETDKDKKSNARFLANSLRFHSHFGCVHYNGV